MWNQNCAVIIVADLNHLNSGERQLGDVIFFIMQLLRCASLLISVVRNPRLALAASSFPPGTLQYCPISTNFHE
jgi:hypothetical protein